MNAKEKQTFCSPELTRLGNEVQYWLYSILRLQPTHPAIPSVSHLAAGSAEALEYQRLFADVFGIPLEVISPKLGIRLRLVPPGTFLMGSPFCEKGRQPHEGPQHEVAITQPMYVATTPITVGAFLAAACSDEIGSTFAERSLGYGPGGVSALQNSGIPERVHDLLEDTVPSFLRRLDYTEGFPDSNPVFQLMTEAEWEYGCRAGTLTPFCSGNNMDTVGWCRANSPAESPGTFGIPGRKLPNAFGLHDMHGLANEMCEDIYHPIYYLKSPTEDPLSKCADRIFSTVVENYRRERTRSRVLRGLGGAAGGGNEVNCRSASRTHGSSGAVRPKIVVDRLPTSALQPLLRLQRKVFDASVSAFRAETGARDAMARDELVATIRNAEANAIEAYQWSGIAFRWICEAYDEKEGLRALEVAEGGAIAVNHWHFCAGVWRTLGMWDKATQCAKRAASLAATVEEYRNCAYELAEGHAGEDARQCAESAQTFAVTAQDWITCADLAAEFLPDWEVVARCVRKAEKLAKDTSDYFSAADRYVSFLGDESASERCRKKARACGMGWRRWWPFRR